MYSFPGKSVMDMMCVLGRFSLNQYLTSGQDVSEGD